MVINMFFDNKGNAKKDGKTILYVKIKQSIENDQLRNDDKDQEKLEKNSDNVQFDIEDLASTKFDIAEVFKKFLLFFLKNKQEKDLETDTEVEKQQELSVKKAQIIQKNKDKIDNQKRYIENISNLLFKAQNNQKFIKEGQSNHIVKNNLAKKQQDMIRKEHIKQLADAINDIGDAPKKGRWVEALSDSHTEKKGRSR
jgi:hypothetical protein